MISVTTMYLDYESESQVVMYTLLKIVVIVVCGGYIFPEGLFPSLCIAILLLYRAYKVAKFPSSMKTLFPENYKNLESTVYELATFKKTKTLPINEKELFKKVLLLLEQKYILEKECSGYQVLPYEVRWRRFFFYKFVARLLEQRNCNDTCFLDSRYWKLQVLGSSRSLYAILNESGGYRKFYLKLALGDKYEFFITFLTTKWLIVLGKICIF